MTDRTGKVFSDLVDILAKLRSPEGCPWDREQTHKSLKRNLLEESYEVLEAIDQQDYKALAEELGDVLLQIVFHSQMASEGGRFTIDEVVAGISEKLVRRHPHVFGDAQVQDAREVEAQWEELKRQERPGDGGQGPESALGKIPAELPALAYSQLVQERAARMGFDWPDPSGALDKVAEEVQEIAEAPTAEEKGKEFGDLLFSLVNAGRWMGLHVEDVLRQANGRFAGRFSAMERLARERGHDFRALPLEQKDALWEEVKKGGAEAV
ncbi:MAG: nucleoside triphosphate pyrophosphohydrolase [Chloroflexi bacterium]|nr:nucleoside triphosphate pyrophosphohydrolase [Chloroflexota bacterium]